MATAFETETCGRCGGSGQYSYCQMYGTRCFGCGGKGVRLTKRGAAASAKLKELRSKRADEAKIGDVYRMDGFCCGPINQPTMWVTITAIEPDELNPGRINIIGDKSDYNVFANTMLRIQHTGEAAERTLAEALAYQTTLTKQGKPMKRNKASVSQPHYSGM